jgi:hypothetical protein
VLSTQFVDYTFKLSINWPVAAVLSTFNWKSGKKMIFSYNILSPVLSSCTLNILWLQGRASIAEPFFFFTDAKPVW